MTPMNQPQSSLALTAISAPSRDRETRRLLEVWVQLTHRTASAAAHHSPNESSLRDLQLQVEEMLSLRLEGSQSLLDELLVWESTLIHAAATPPGDCLICRKARRGLPDDLRARAGLGCAR